LLPTYPWSGAAGRESGSFALVVNGSWSVPRKKVTKSTAAATPTIARDRTTPAANIDWRRRRSEFDKVSMQADQTVRYESGPTRRIAIRNAVLQPMLSRLCSRRKRLRHALFPVDLKAIPGSSAALSTTTRLARYDVMCSQSQEIHAMIQQIRASLSCPFHKIVCTLLVVSAISQTCSRLETASADEREKSVSVAIDFGDGVELKYTALNWREEMTVQDAMSSVEKHPRGVKLETRGSGATAMLLKIDDLKNEGGVGKGWMYRVNGKLADRGFGVYQLKAGDAVLWTFEKYR